MVLVKQEDDDNAGSAAAAEESLIDSWTGDERLLVVGCGWVISSTAV